MYDYDAPQEVAWIGQSTNIIASMLTDYGTILIAANYPIDHIHPSMRGLYEHIITEYKANSSIATISSIENKLGPDVAKLAQSIKDKFNPDFNATFDFALEQQGGFSARSQLAKMGKDLLKVSGNTDEVLSDVEDRIRQIKQSSASFPSGDMETVLSEASALADVLPYSVVKTGINWLDKSLNGGCYPGMNYWIAGGYKSGKTTLARNIALNMLEQGHAVAFIMAESSRDMLIFDLLAMMVNKSMLASDSAYLCHFSGLKLFNAVGLPDKAAVFSKDELAAYHDACDRLKQFKLYAWDTRHGITNLSRFGSLINQIVTDYDCKVIIADHSQLFGDPRDNTFEKQSKTARFVLDMAIQNQIVFWMLTQMNEEKLKGKVGKNSHSIGIRGGGDAAAAAEMVLTTKIEEGETGNIMNIAIAHSRRSGKGYYSNFMDRHSGLFTSQGYETETTISEHEISLEDLETSFLNVDQSPFVS